MKYDEVSIYMQLFDLSCFGLLKAAGSDAKKLLQGQLTCHLDELLSHQSLLGGHCNPKGRLLSLFQLFQHEQDYFLFMPREMISSAMAALKKYAIFYKVTLVDASDDFTRLGFIPGPSHEIFPDKEIVKIKLADNPARYLLLKEKQAPLSFLGPLQSVNEWKALNINNGLVYIYPETVGRFLPHEINLHLQNGISLTKGCYTGQEIIARMHYLGKLKMHCYHAAVNLNSPPTAGTAILNDSSNIVGTLVDFSYQADQPSQLIFISNEENIRQNSLFLNQSQVTLK